MPAAKGSVPWNAGMGTGWVDDRGYRWLYVEEGGKRVSRREHRVLMERHLGRRLEPWEIVHHKDGNPSNNSLDNLEVKEFGEHTADHHKGTRKSWEARRSMEAFALLREELRRCRASRSDLLEALKEQIAADDAMSAFVIAADRQSLDDAEWLREHAERHRRRLKALAASRAALAKAAGDAGPPRRPKAGATTNPTTES